MNKPDLKYDFSALVDFIQSEKFKEANEKIKLTASEAVRAMKALQETLSSLEVNELKPPKPFQKYKAFGINPRMRRR